MKLVLALSFLLVLTPLLNADGLVRPPRSYSGSLEERAQEAILVFTPGTESKSAVQDLILKIRVEGKVDDFAWIVPLPAKPTTHKEEPVLFEECFNYVESRSRRPAKADIPFSNGIDGALQLEEKAVEVLSREVVGSFDVAIVKENQEGALNAWLKEEGYQEIKDGEETIRFYREKGFVFACMKVADTALSNSGTADLHPIRFTFETGGRDGIYFPMKLTGLQEEEFDVNLYVFYGAWLNDHLNGYGFEHRGFRLRWRDYDSPQCKSNAGKSWSAPKSDPYLSSYASRIPELTRYFQTHYPGKKFYLTNLTARGLKPEQVRQWTNDLWLFPYYTNRKMIPYDAREGGIAALKE